MSSHRKVAIVTGSGRGIGEATARKFSESDYQVVGVDLRAEEDSQRGYEVLACDVSHEDEVEHHIYSLLSESSGANGNGNGNGKVAVAAK